MPKADHVRLDLQTFEFRCHHCGASHVVRQDQRELRKFVAASEAFLKLHKTCPKQEGFEPWKAPGGR